MRKQTSDVRRSDFRRSDYQTEKGRFKEKDLRGETVRRQTIRLAERLVMFQPLTVDHMVAGDFSTPLRCARNDGGFARQSDGQISDFRWGEKEASKYMPFRSHTIRECAP